jgi:hypothetical protein
MKTFLHTIKISLSASIFTILLLSLSCVGPKGNDGIDGYNGKDGRDGKDGYNGRDGKDGEDANVGAAVYDIAPSDWTGNIDGFVTTLDFPELTEDIYYNGAVLVYMLKNEDSVDKSFNQLPYTWLSNTYTEYMDFDAFIGQIDITLRWVDNGINNTEAPTGTYTFKIIIISGTPLSVLETKTDISDPDAVMAYLSGNAIF